MDNYIINKRSGRVMKIGSKAHKQYIMKNIRQNNDNKIILSNLEYDDYKKLKKSLPVLEPNKFYYYESKTKILMTKNKSVKQDELITHICNMLPTIIDKILDEINDDDDRDKTKAKMINIFHQSIC